MVLREGAKCELCKATSQKRFPTARGLRQHLRCKHKALHLDDRAIDALISQATFPLSRTKPVTTTTAAWISAAQAGDISVLQDLKRRGEWRWDSKDRHGAIAEHFAAGSGQLDCMKYCLSERKKLCPVHGEARVSGGGSRCVCPGQVEKMKRNDGRFSVHWAARKNHRTVLDWLIKTHVVDIDAPTFDGTTPLHLAVLGCHASLVRFMVERLGADPGKRNRWGCDLSHWLGLTTCEDAQRVEATCVEVFERLGLGIDVVNQEGHSVLHKAALKGNGVLLKWILARFGRAGRRRLEAAAKPDAKGNTPMDLARRCGHAGFARELEGYILVKDERTEGNEEGKERGKRVEHASEERPRKKARMDLICDDFLLAR